MLTYSLTDENCPLYEALYRHIREDILSRRLRPGEKLPSKRALAVHLEVSKVTVEAAYGQLLAEGYIRAQEKVGYFVEALQESLPLPAKSMNRRQMPLHTAGSPRNIQDRLWPQPRQSK